MRKLDALLLRYADARAARWWVGARPAVPEARAWMEIAGQVGYPTASPEYFSQGLCRLDVLQAAHILAVAGTTSLAYDCCAPSKSEVDRAAQALLEFAPEPTLFSNGLWRPGASNSWSPLTTATFDCGLIGYDDDQAFIFWVEEED